MNDDMEPMFTQVRIVPAKVNVENGLGNQGRSFKIAPETQALVMLGTSWLAGDQMRVDMAHTYGLFIVPLIVDDGPAVAVQLKTENGMAVHGIFEPAAFKKLVAAFTHAQAVIESEIEGMGSEHGSSPPLP